MKKIATLLLAAGLVFGAATGSSAIEFNAKGQWIMSFDLGAGGLGYSQTRTGAGKTTASGYDGGTDNFNAQQRVRLQLDAVASEALSGTIIFEIGNQQWGDAGTGGALGTDGQIVEVKHAYLDWIVPNTALKIRMGLQNIALPTFTMGSSQILNNDMAGIAASYQFNDNVGATFVWARPANDNFAPRTTPAVANAANAANNVFDNIDIFAVIVPMSFNNVKIAPWAAYAVIGRNSLDLAVNPAGALTNNAFGVGGLVGMLPQMLYNNDGSNNSGRLSSYGQAYWLGLTGEVAAGSGLRFAWDANYGASDLGRPAYSREGWYLDALVEYKMNWGTPGLYAWYGSGDDANPKNGSERLPSFSNGGGDDQRSMLAGNGTPYLGREDVLATNWAGTMGVGARLKDMSFMEDFKHTLRLNYIQGTNNPKMAKYLATTRTTAAGTFLNRLPGAAGTGTANRRYLTTVDNAIEVGLTNTYQIYDNLVMYAELDYIFLSMNNDTWKNNGGGGVSRTDPWNVNVSFVYSF